MDDFVSKEEELVLAVIEDFGSFLFTVQEVHNKISSKVAKGDLYKILKKLRRKHVITMTQEGAGKQPAIYKQFEPSDILPKKKKKTFSQKLQDGEINITDKRVVQKLKKKELRESLSFAVTALKKKHASLSQKEKNFAKRRRVFQESAQQLREENWVLEKNLQKSNETLESIRRALKRTVDYNVPQEVTNEELLQKVAEKISSQEELLAKLEKKSSSATEEVMRTKASLKQLSDDVERTLTISNKKRLIPSSARRTTPH